MVSDERIYQGRNWRLFVTHTSLIAWRARLGIRSRAEAARRLGLARNTYAAYEEGRTPIPLYVALACAALAFGLPPQN